MFPGSNPLVPKALPWKRVPLIANTYFPFINPLNRIIMGNELLQSSSALPQKALNLQSPPAPPPLQRKNLSSYPTPSWVYHSKSVNDGIIRLAKTRSTPTYGIIQIKTQKIHQERRSTDVAEQREKATESIKREIAEQMWLNYFNQTLYTQGIISESERNRMTTLINNHKPLPPPAKN